MIQHPLGLLRRCAALSGLVLSLVSCSTLKESWCDCDQKDSTKTEQHTTSAASKEKDSWWPFWKKDRAAESSAPPEHTTLPPAIPVSPGIDARAQQPQDNAQLAASLSQASGTKGDNPHSSLGSATVLSSEAAQEDPQLSKSAERMLLCPRTAYLSKTVAVNIFIRRELESAKAGRLEAVESGLATLFRDALIAEKNLVPTLFHAPVTPQTIEQHKREATISIARKQQAQFVLQGYIDDMALMNANKTYHPSLLDKATYLLTDRTSATALDKRHRYFGVTLELRDGFTGEVIFTEDYHTWAFWKFKHPVGFNTTQFQTSDYGNKIRALVQQATSDLTDALACQPLIARLDVHPGRKDMLLDAGANHGLRAGDALALYQLITLGSNTDYMATQTRLVKRPPTLMLNEVYPSHANATLNDAQPIAGSFLAVKE